MYLMCCIMRHTSIVLPVKAVKGNCVGNQAKLTHIAAVGQ